MIASGLVVPLPAPCVVVLIAPAGAGKTTLAARLTRALPGVAVLSYDRFRRVLTGNSGDQSATPTAIRLVHARLNSRCAAGRSTVVDGTHTVHEHRAPLLRIADRHGIPAVAVVLATPLKTCLARQLDREPPPPGARWGRRVPEPVVRQMHAAVHDSIPQLHREGFASVHLLNLREPTTGEPTVRQGGVPTR